MIKTILAIGAGSFLGGVARYAMSRYAQLSAPTLFPIGILTVNLLGCLAIGLLYGLLERQLFIHESRLLLFLMVGFLGSFTTFSTFSLDNMLMIRQGHFPELVAYILLSVAGGLLLTYAGFWASRFVG